MTSEELAEQVQDAIIRCKGRVMGVGNDQYSQGDQQKFETLTPNELLEWALEESDDLIVYGVMVGIRIKQILASVDGATLKTHPDPAQ